MSARGSSPRTVSIRLGGPSRLGTKRSTEWVRWYTRGFWRGNAAVATSLEYGCANFLPPDTHRGDDSVRQSPLLRKSPGPRTTCPCSMEPLTNTCLQHQKSPHCRMQSGVTHLPCWTLRLSRRVPLANCSAPAASSCATHKNTALRQRNNISIYGVRQHTSSRAYYK